MISLGPARVELNAMGVDIHHVEAIKATIALNKARSYQISLVDTVGGQARPSRILSLSGLIFALFFGEIMPSDDPIDSGYRDWGQPYFLQVPVDRIGANLRIFSVLKLDSYFHDLSLELMGNAISLMMGGLRIILKPTRIPRLISLKPFEKPSLATPQLPIYLLWFFAQKKSINTLFSNVMLVPLTHDADLRFLRPILLAEGARCADTNGCTMC